MTKKTTAVYAAPEIEILSYGESRLICASIDHVTEENFEFDWI